LLTKIAPVRANRRAKCPLFKNFLRRITGDDAALRVFIQKAVGYSLTGVTTEQVFFFVYGKSGNNGKSTLVNLIRDMLGDYGRHTPIETLLTKQYDNNIPSDLARLAGARMVTAIEANFNRPLDEAKIKAMTGGDPPGSCGTISSRFNPSSSCGSSPTTGLGSKRHRRCLLAAGARHPARRQDSLVRAR
jgi:putative DNA primase/helicase